MTVVSEPAQASLLLKRLRAALIADFEPELVDTCRAGVLLAAGYRPIDVRRRLDMTPSDFARVQARLERVCERLDLGDD